MEDHRAAIWTGRHVADHLRLEATAGQGLLEAQRFGQGLLDIGRERDLCMLAAGGIDVPELALRPDHQRLRIGGPGVVRVRPEDRPGFLHVVREAVPERLRLAALEIEAMQHGLVAHALDEGQRAPVR